MFVQADAINEMLAHAMEAPKHWVPEKFMEEQNKPEHVNQQEFCAGVTHPDTGETITSYQKLMQIPALKHVWEEAMCKELGKISNGWNDTEGTQTVRFLTHEEIAAIPSDRTITYARIVVDYRKQKNDPNRVRITVGGNLLKDDQELTVRTADLTTSKVMWNSTISTPGARFMCSDINGFYLETPLPKKEYMRMDMRDIPQAF